MARMTSKSASTTSGGCALADDTGSGASRDDGRDLTSTEEIEKILDGLPKSFMDPVRERYVKYMFGSDINESTTGETAGSEVRWQARTTITDISHPARAVDQEEDDEEETSNETESNCWSSPSGDNGASTAFKATIVNGMTPAMKAANDGDELSIVMLLKHPNIDISIIKYRARRYRPTSDDEEGEDEEDSDDEGETNEDSEGNEIVDHETGVPLSVRDGWTALTYAASKGHTSICHYLLSRGVMATSISNQKEVSTCFVRVASNRSGQLRLQALFRHH